MKVTPLDIRRKEFKRSVRGYADEEVDLFLDEVADELERIHQENTEILERLRRQEEQLAGVQQLREALEKALVSAQLQADDTRAIARREADALRVDAERQAQALIGESYGEVQKVQQTLLQLKHLEEDFRFKFRSLLEGHLKLLAEPPLSKAAVEAVVAESPPVMTAPEGMAEAASATPFVVPSAFEAVPEYPAATAIRPEESVVSDAVAAMITVVPQPGIRQAAAPLSEDETADQTQAPPSEAAQPFLAREAAFSPEPVPLFAAAAEGPSAGDPPGVLGDDSVTFATEADPLSNFFFAPRQDGPDGGNGGKNRPRDFEW